MCPDLGGCDADAGGSTYIDRGERDCHIRRTAAENCAGEGAVKDFELLVMDEATAALDMETEMAVIDSIRQIKENKTLIMVTHHMSLANECDVVYRIEDRKILRVK